MIANVRARHDGPDLRRLAELGIVALEWRHAPARSSRTIIIDSDDAANTTLKDIMKGLAIVGISAHLRGRDAPGVPSADPVVFRFGAVDMTTSPDDSSATLLPPLAELRGNAAAKRQAWSQMRALMRS